MNGIGLVLLAVLLGGASLLLWHRYRRQRRLRVTHHSLRCPIHGGQAEVAVETDPLAQSCRQYVAVRSCSFLSDVAVGLPERTAYLADGPPFKVRLEPPRSSPVYTAEVSCPQHCVFVLNAAAVSGVPQPVECTSGASDAINLVEQTIRNPRISRILWYSSL